MRSIALTFILSSIMIFSSHAQTVNEDKDQKKLEEFESLKTLIETKQYRFTSTKAFPQKGPMIDMINRSNLVKVDRDNGFADLSYFGRAYSGGYSGDMGINFDGPFDSYEVILNEKKHRITVKFKIKGSNDTYNCILSASNFESASLSVSSNNKQAIRYSGVIARLEE